jgi:hypothetical protein
VWRLIVRVGMGMDGRTQSRAYVQHSIFMLKQVYFFGCFSAWRRCRLVCDFIVYRVGLAALVLLAFASSIRLHLTHNTSSFPPLQSLQPRKHPYSH